MISKADVVIMGAGVVGSAIARELSRYDLKVVLVERNEDVGGYASKCNSATLCNGHDAPVGSLEAALTSASNRAYDRICKELDVEMQRIGMIYVAHNEEEMEALREIRGKAILNGSYNVEMLTREQVHEMEPALAPDIVGGFLVPDESIVDVMELVYAFVENAMDNGVELALSTTVLGVNTDPVDNHVLSVETDRGTIECQFAINCAAIYADKIAQSVGFCDYYNYPRTGLFYVLDKWVPYRPEHIIVPLPTPISRGKLITPTIHGNCLIGPSAVNMVDREDTSNYKQTMDEVLADTRLMIPAIDPKDSITQFTGVRPAIYPKNDWRIRAIDGCHGYIEAVGISQGVSGAPGVSMYVAELLRKEGLKMVEKPDWKRTRKAVRRFNKMTDEERDQAIAENPAYGKVICRCETVTEAEIVEVIHRGPGARSVDAVKRRLRAGMGRCQGGFCGPRVVEILARELGVTEEEICKNEPGSEMLARVNKE